MVTIGQLLALWKTGLWESAFQDSLLDPGGFAVVIDRYCCQGHCWLFCHSHGFLGRLRSFQLLYGTDGGMPDRLSSIANLPQFTSHLAPSPIITSIEVAPRQCMPADRNAQFEMHPYEYGSWNNGIAAFTQSLHLGTSLEHNQPAVNGSCMTTSYTFLGHPESFQPGPVFQFQVQTSAMPKLGSTSYFCRD
jgi:lysophospholipase